MDYKDKTKQAYNSYSKDFEDKFVNHFVNGGVGERADLFIRHLPGKRVIDIGAGPGMHSRYFSDHGLDVLAIDISEKMIELCKARGLNAKVMDMLEMHFPASSFDGAWAYTSLLHLKKSDFERVVMKIAGMLVPGGMLAIALKEGQGEGFETHVRYPNTQRWFSYYTKAELEPVFDKWFEILDFNRNEFNKHVFISYLLKKK